ncbi:MAG TPA: cell division protein FtsL [Pyrinomonadaceae bacterium]
MNRIPESQRNLNVRRTRDVTALSRLAVLLFFGVVLAGGFLFAARQHFAAVQSGYQSENLRAEREKLIEENQRLALEKETISAPQRLEPKARELGMQPATAGQIAPAENAKVAE